LRVGNLREKVAKLEGKKKNSWTGLQEAY